MQAGGILVKQLQLPDRIFQPARQIVRRQQRYLEMIRLIGRPVAHPGDVILTADIADPFAQVEQGAHLLRLDLGQQLGERGHRQRIPARILSCAGS